MNRRRKIIFCLFIAFVLLGFISIWVVGGSLCKAWPRKIGPPPKDFPAETIQIESSSGSNLSGWLLRAEEAKGVVILMHGVRGCRLDMLQRGRFLYANGYTVILFDFQAHGESSGKNITFGYLESKDAAAVVGFARQKFPAQKIVAIGGSLGGAAAILATPSLKVEGMVLEMVYPTIKQAVAARLKIKLGNFGACFTPLLTCQLKPRLGFDAENLRPIEKVKNLTMPKLFIGGDEDKHTPLNEARDLFEAAAEPKQFWEIKGAGHIDLHAYASAEYEKRILKFLGECNAPDVDKSAE